MNSLLSSCSRYDSLCYTMNVVEYTKSVQVKLLDKQPDDTYYIKSIEDDNSRHFVGFYRKDTPIYSDNKLVLPEDEEYPSLEEKVLASDTFFVDFRRNYMPCVDEKGNKYRDYGENTTEIPDSSAKDYILAGVACVYFEKMTDDFYNSSDYDLNYGKFR